MNEKKHPIGLHPDLQNLFLESERGTYSYSDLFRFARYFKNTIHQKNSDQGAVVGLHADSSDELIFIIAACWLNQIPFVSFNPEIKQPASPTVKPTVLITDQPKSNSQPNLLSINSFDLSSILNMIKVEESLDKTIALTANPEEKFGYFFTSGTSGPPKTVPLKRRQLISAATSSAQNIRPNYNEYWLLCLPLYHIGGVSVILRSLLYGSAIYRMDRFDKRKTWNLLSNNKKVVAASLVPTMLKRLTDDPSFSTHHKVQAILLGGGPIYPSLLTSCMARNIPLITSYGMTETCAQIAANPIKPRDYEHKLNSIGKIFDPNKVEIRDKTGIAVNTEISGSIWLKGPQIFDGYLDSDQTNFDNNGWFNTGDFGKIDNEGDLYIESRRTDLIITGGENVSPFEVEAAFQKIEGIKEAVVFGMPDEEWGQKVVAAVIFTNEEKISEQDIIKSLKQSIEPYKVPKRVVVVNVFPRTETGKIKRAILPSLLNQIKNQ